VRHRESLLEGTTRPVVPILVLKAVAIRPEDEQLRLLSKFLVAQELEQ
jgi:hypothetical protein